MSESEASLSNTRFSFIVPSKTGVFCEKYETLLYSDSKEKFFSDLSVS